MVHSFAKFHNSVHFLMIFSKNRNQQRKYHFNRFHKRIPVHETRHCWKHIFHNNKFNIILNELILYLTQFFFDKLFSKTHVARIGLVKRFLLKMLIYSHKFLSLIYGSEQNRRKMQDPRAGEENTMCCFLKDLMR